MKHGGAISDLVAAFQRGGGTVTQCAPGHGFAEQRQARKAVGNAKVFQLRHRRGRARVLLLLRDGPLARGELLARTGIEETALRRVLQALERDGAIAMAQLSGRPVYTIKPEEPNMSEATRLTIEISGKKNAGKTALIERLLLPALSAVGAKLVARAGRNGAEHVAVDIPAGSLAGEERPLIVPFADLAAAQEPKAPQPVELTPMLLSKLRQMDEAFWKASTFLREDMIAVSVTAPSFVEREHLRSLVSASALQEMSRIRAEFAALGFRYVEAPAK